MNLTDYNAFVLSRMDKGDKRIPLEFAALGLAGEFGELGTAIASKASDDEVELEIGDVLWYATAVQLSLGFSNVMLFDGSIDKTALQCCHEICELVKKKVWHGKDIDSWGIVFLAEKIKADLALLAETMDLTIEEIRQSNYDKVMARYPDGMVDGGGIR